MTLEELQVVITARTAPLQAQLATVNRQLSGLQANTSKSMSGVQNSVNRATAGVRSAASKLKTALIALGIGKVLKDSFDITRMYEANVQQINRLFGSYASAMDSWIKKNATMFGMARADAMKYASVYGNLLSGFLGSQSEMSTKTQELLKATTIVASSTGRSVSDVSERIRSGLLGNTESIEDLGINVNVALLETTEAFKQLANGKSWEKLSFQTQQQIRLMAILEQASTKFGDSIQQNTNFQLMQLTANLKNVALNIGQAFMPIVSVVLPVLNSMALALSNVTARLAEFMNALFGTDFTAGAGANQVGVGFDGAADSAKNAGEEAEKAGKAAKNALAAFDEVNTLPKDAGSGLGDTGAGAGGDVTNTPLPTSPLSQNMIDVVEKFKVALEPTIEALKRLGEALKPFEEFVWQGLKDFYELVLKPIGSWVMGEGLPRFIDSLTKLLNAVDWERINESLRKVFEAIAPFAIKLGEGLLWFIENVLVPLGAWTLNEAIPRYLEILATAIGIISKVVGESIETIKQFFTEFLIPLAKYAEPKILKYFDDFKTKLEELAKLINESTAFEDFREILSAIYDALMPIAKLLIDISIWFIDFKMSNTFINLKYALKDIEDALGFVAAILRGDFSDAWEHFKDLLINNRIDKAKEQLELFGKKFNEVKEIVIDFVNNWLENIDKMFSGWGKAISEWWDNNVVPWFTREKWEEILFNIGASFAEALVEFITFWNTDVPEWFENDVKPWFTLEKWSGIFNNIKTSLANKWSETVTWWSTAISSWWNEKVTPWFTKEKWIELGTNIKNGLIDGFRGAVNGITGLLNSILSAFEGMVNSVLDGINKIVEGYNSVAAVSPVPLPAARYLSGFTIPKIPMLARGGIIDSPTIAMIGEAGKEAVIPLENTSFVDKLATSVGNAVLTAMQFIQYSGGNNNEGPTIIEMDSVEVGRTLMPVIKSEMYRTGFRWE